MARALRRAAALWNGTGVWVFVLRRLAWSLGTVVGVVAVTFMVSHVIPADPAALVAGERATREQIEALRHQLGFDQPLITQLFDYYVRLVQGDLGKSLFTSRQVSADLLARLPATIELALAAMIVTIGLGVPIGVLAALRRNAWFDQIVRIVTVSGLAIASFWLAIILQLTFAMDVGWLPLGGRLPADVTPPPSVTGLYTVDALLAGQFETFITAILHLALPTVTLAFPAMATIVRFTRAGMLDTLNKPFVQYERAMGLPESLIVWKYMLRNALTSTVTQIGLVSGTLLGGAVVIEAVFDWPGLGYYAVNSIVMSDYNAVLGFTVWVAIIYIVINIAVDVLHRLIDPRSAG
ncbi:ABC transporter permease [Reyranella sp.]|uniref:ABC transporter permease n=1 Tax=Reyranella sp. TaxID=1929291 RepID=UPI003D0FA2AB